MTRPVGVPMTNDNREATRIFHQVVEFYDAMHRHSVVEKYGPEQVEMRVFRGYVTSVLREIDLPTTLYSKLKQRLEKLECTFPLERGANGVPSVVALLKHPRDADWARSKTRAPNGLTENLTRGEVVARLSQSVEDIRQQIGGINYIDMLQNFETRLRALESGLAELRQQQSEQLRLDLTEKG